MTHTVCSWCRQVIQEGDRSQPWSHGICTSCAQREREKRERKRRKGLAFFQERVTKVYGAEKGDKLFGAYRLKFGDPGVNTDTRVFLFDIHELAEEFGFMTLEEEENEEEARRISEGRNL